MKRLISSTSSDMLSYTAEELKQSIKASEGRTILSENIVTIKPWVDGVTNSEIARAYGADLILLNMLDVFDPKVEGLGQVSDVVKELKRLTGRPIGVNLEPVDDAANMMENSGQISSGRKASPETLKAIQEMGMDFVCFTGNPGTGVTNKAIEETIKICKDHFDGLIIAGKMHSSGVDEPVCDKDTIESFVDAGADIILVPSIGTIQGFDEDQLKEACKNAHKVGALVMSAIGTSQEGARPETIRQMAVTNKMCGVDIQHIGDAGYTGLAPVENIYEMSIAIRGLRHTLAIISKSVNR